MVNDYKNSGITWAEQIPSDWKVIRGKNLLKLMNRPVRETDDVVTCFRDGEVILRSERRTEGFTMSDKEIGYQGINKGDIVIHGMDGFAGSMGVSKSTGKGSPVLIVCNPKEDDDSRYIIYYLRALAMNNVFLALATGIRERSCDLRWNKISELPFIRPKADEQKCIADYIDNKIEKIDGLIELQEQMIAQLMDYKQSVITEAVTKGLNPNVEFIPSGIDWIGDIPIGWTIGRIKNVAILYGRIGFRGYTSEDLNKDGKGAITLSPSNMLPMGMDYSNVTYLSWAKYYESPEIMIQNNDLLMVKTGSSYGKVSYVNNLPREATINPQILRIIPKMSSKYLGYFMQSPIFLYQVEGGVVGGTIPTIAQEKINNFKIILPPEHEQLEIVSLLDTKCTEIDSLISLKQQKIETLKEYKKSVIFEAVTGKTCIE